VTPPHLDLAQILLFGLPVSGRLWLALLRSFHAYRAERRDRRPE
jgi:hypothetical protein